MMTRGTIGAALVAALFWTGGSLAAEYDLVIRNGRVLDGAGNPWVRADVAISDGRFVKIGHVTGRGRTEIDAAVTGPVSVRRSDVRGLHIRPGDRPQPLHVGGHARRRRRRETGVDGADRCERQDHRERGRAGEKTASSAPSRSG